MGADTSQFGIVSIKLGNGKDIAVDLHKIAMSEFREAIDPKTDPERSDTVVAKTCGMTLDEFRAKIGQPDYRRIIAAFWRAATQPIEDDVKRLRLTDEQAQEFGVKFGDVVEIVPENPTPNSASESISA